MSLIIFQFYYFRTGSDLRVSAVCKKKKKSFAFKWVHALKSLTENQRNENEKKNLKRTLREFKVGDIMAKILEGCEDC